MRCSWCETLLDRYLEASLDAVQMREVATHLRGCDACEALHRRVRIVDGLLATVRALELEPNFTFAVMAQVRAMPAPVPPRTLWPALVLFYLAAAWIGFGAAVALLRRSTLPAIPNAAQALGGALRAIEHGAAALLPAAPLAMPFVVGVLSIDVLLLAALVFFYRAVRPRLWARLGAAEAR